MTNPQQTQPRPKQLALKDRLVVGADCAGFAVAFDGVERLPYGGWLQSAVVTTYDSDGQVAAQVNFGRYATNWLKSANSDFQNGTLPDEKDDTPNVSPFASSDGQLVQGSLTNYTGHDRVGNVTAYAYNQPNVFGANYTVNYLKKDGYLEQSTTGTATVSGYVPATDTSYYDGFGRRTAVSQTSQGNSGAAQNTTRVFGYDTSGEIVQKRSGTVSGSTFTPFGGGSIDHYTYVDGEQTSVLDESGGISVLDTLTGFSDSASTQGYVIQAGDTLASIAQAVYGDSSYGYLIGQANGIGASDALVQGQAITLPSITTSSNSATTFKPYNAGQIVGSTTPNLPTAPPPPPSRSGCSGLAEIVVVAVAIVASIYTAGAAAEAFGAAEVGGSTLVTGAAALGGTLAETGAGIAGALVGGVAGSVAGQLTGDALGVSSGLSLDQALTAGLAAGLTAGIGGEISGGGGVLANADGSLRPAGAALFGAGAYASGVAAANVTGQAEHFSWAGLAASAVGSGLTAAAGLEGEPLQRVGESAGSFTQDLAGGLLSGGLTRETSQLLGDDHVQSWQQIGEDAFGNALGNAAVTPYQPTNPATAYNPDNDALLKYAQGYQNEMTFEQQAQAEIDGSPILLASTSAPPSLMDTVYGRTLSTDGSWPSSGSDPLASADGDQLITMPGYTSTWGRNDAEGHPVTDLEPMQVTVSASSQAPADYSNTFSTSSLSAIDQQLMDVVPGSNLQRQLQQQKATQGLFSTDPALISQGQLAALELQADQAREMSLNGVQPMPTVGAPDPDALANQRRLNAVFGPLVASVLLTGVAAGGVEPVPIEAPPMDSLEPLSLQQGSAAVSAAAPSTTAAGNVQPTGPYIELGSDEAIAAQNAYNQAFNSQNTLVIGRLEDTAAGADLGMTRLYEPNWTINVNDAWIQGGIDAEQPFYLGSNISIGNLRSGNPTYPTTVFFRELQQLRGAGYYQEGNYMLPPNGN